jgi:predicted Zn-dependent protease
VEVFRFKSEKNELAAATARLQEAFTTSEFQPPVLGLERSEKQKVEDYITRLDKMQNLIEAHDFGPLENLIDETKNAVADFDATKPLALVNAVKLESKLHLGKAKLSAQQGDLKTAMDEFQEAAKAWPANPDLQDSSTAFFNSQDTKSQSTTEFDRLVGESNYREIFDKQLLFATAVHGDSKREEQLKDARVKIKNAEIATEKANVMRNAGDVDGAWETIELAAKDLPNDNKLNALRADLAGKGAEFVEAINKAKDAETRSDLGYSLTWYAVAQRYYPASVMANEAIDRISKQILKSGNANAY